MTKLKYKTQTTSRLSPPKQLRLGLQLGCIERLASQVCILWMVRSCFDARPHVDVIRRSRSRGSGLSTSIIVAAFALFRRSAINLLITVTLLITLD